MIPPIEERRIRPCNGSAGRCVFLISDQCLCSLSDFTYVDEREFDRFVHPCGYHMTIEEYGRLIDSGKV